MLEKIQAALQRNSDIKAWIIRQESILSSQQYELQDRTESIREVSSELYTIDVLSDTENEEGKLTSGQGRVSILPSGKIEPAIEKALLTAQLVHNPPYDFVSPASVPEVKLTDQFYLTDPHKKIDDVLRTLKETTEAYPHVRLTAAECFGQKKKTHLVSSKGIDAEQTATEIYLQWVYIGGEGDSEVETFAEISRRRIEDLNLKEEAALRAQYTSDLLNAGKPKNYTGPVIVAGESLAVMVAGEMLAGSLLQTLSSASLKHSGETPWELGKSIFRENVKGDDFNVWANRRLPYGVPSSAFDQEGIPAQRVRLIEDNKLAAFMANQRYAQYLDMKPSGSFGSLEMSPGNHTEADLRSGSYVEIAEFSWFNPDPMTGNFACEIRLGYQVKDGQRVPFKGGMLVGNLLDALGNVHWSEEIGFYGNYLGPKAARFNLLQVAG